MLATIAYVTTIIVNIILISCASALGIALYLREKKKKEALKAFKR